MFTRRPFRFPTGATRANLPSVRVPIPVVVVLALAVIAGVWWQGTRTRDFLTAPTAEQLAATKAKVDLLPQADFPDDAVSAPPTPPPPPPPPPPKPKPVIGLGDLSQPPEIDEYAASALLGGQALVELAARLEKKNEPQRAALAWERVLDTGKSDPSQIRAAVNSLERLRSKLPPWNTAKSEVITVKLNATTSKKNAKALTTAAEKVAREMQTASAGILKVTVNVASSSKHPSSSRSPTVGLWLAGSNKKPAVTETRVFTVSSPESLHDDVLKTVFELVHGYFVDHPPRRPPVVPADGNLTADALQSHITRLQWQELGKGLNPPPPPKKSD